MVEWFNNLDKTVKIIFLIPIWGWVFSALYRIFKFIDDNESITPLVAGILCFIPIIGFILSVVDIATVAQHNKITVLAD